MIMNWPFFKSIAGSKFQTKCVLASQEFFRSEIEKTRSLRTCATSQNAFLVSKIREGVLRAAGIDNLTQTPSPKFNLALLFPVKI